MTAKKTPAIKPETLNLHQRIHEIMKDVEFLVKDGKIEYKNVSYRAVTEGQVTTAVRKALIEHGVTCIPTGEIQWNQVGTLNTVIMDYRLTNIDKPDDFLIIPTVGQGADTQDKGTNKAVTGAFKYLLLRTFNIPTGDDPDEVSSKELEEKHNKELKKKYDKLVSDNKDLFTVAEIKQMKFNPKWTDAKVISVMVRLNNAIEKKRTEAEVPINTSKDTMSASDAADHAGQPIEQMDL